MTNKSLVVVLSLTALILLSSAGLLLVQAQAENRQCETCPMTVDAEAQEHFKVYDGDGNRHWVECTGCTFKLLKTYDSLHVETFCDWYGPEYPITIDISQHGAVATVNPPTVLLLVGGGCTGNRIAYNQTAADELLSKGFSSYTMHMMQQILPANTNVTTVSAKAMTFAASSIDETPQNYLAPAIVAVVGVAVIVVAAVAYKKMKKQKE